MDIEAVALGVIGVIGDGDLVFVRLGASAAALGRRSRTR